MKTTSILFLLSLTLLSGSLFAQQNSAGKCYSNDYHLWNDNGTPDLYGDCGTDALLNTGNEITLEVWVRAYSFGENRKVMGKKFGPNLNNNGYVLGFENLNVYTEISNSGAVIEVPHASIGPMPVDSGWIHIASTYKADGKAINYINGNNIGETDVFPQAAIADSEGPFIIGRAPWGFSYLFYGDLDEVRVWNVQRSGAEIKASMFKELTGNEEGLVAYYNFNQPSDSIFYDQTENENDGVIKKYEHIAFNWTDSYAPVSDSKMYDMHDVDAAWYGKKATGYNSIDTLQGLSFTTDIDSKEFQKYLIAGHNNLSGTTEENLPENAPEDSKRLNRTWYVNKAGAFNTTLVFDLKKSAAEEDTLPTFHADTLYTLLKLNETTGIYEPKYSANTAYFDANNYNLVYEDIELSDGYYTVGYSSTRMAFGSSISEKIKPESLIKIYPNPAENYIRISNSKDTKLEIFNIAGSKVFESRIESDLQKFDLQALEKGIYIIQIKNSKLNKTSKFIIQ